MHKNIQDDRAKIERERQKEVSNVTNLTFKLNNMKLDLESSNKLYNDKIEILEETRKRLQSKHREVTADFQRVEKTVERNREVINEQKLEINNLKTKLIQTKQELGSKDEQINAYLAKN